MGISDMLNRRVRARPTDDDESVYSGGSDMGDEVRDKDGQSDAEDQQSHSSQGSDASAGEEDEDEDGSNLGEEEFSDAGDDNEDIQASLSSVSFGALAKAQASMGSKKGKEKRSQAGADESTTASPLDDIRAKIREAREQKRDAAAKEKSKEKKAARASKHAPMVQSSKHAVTRRRLVVEPPAVAKARDPRFDAAVMGYSGSGKYSEGANKNYAFLDDYRVSELKDLKMQLSKTKNADAREELKMQIRSAEDQMKTRKNQKREREVMADHKKKEKQLIREGKKSTPYYLKQSELKKAVLEKKYEEMGSRDRAKALERRRKKIASKERKDMPFERRGMDDAPPDRGGQASTT
ncbi:rRNA biogenesis protein rrp36 [Penicillium manginii]|uniref:rRNA biogenesis protein rrp36 n=1 Tax=Penicillium manginii TaxID=203109 RepID=UPI0025465FFB|nr:rRNA biogenesis protein rrp36 [Penicillium manginii]KAJ5734723.1 rRNA biogenesis protein rrp36 [Penicillium manginii]